MIGRRILAAFGLAAACLGSTSSSCRFGASSDDLVGPSFVTDLALRNAAGESRNVFDRGERIDLALTVRNRLDTPTDVQFSSGRTSDFVIVRENSGGLVWKWSADKAFTQVITEIAFAASESRTFDVTWNQADAQGTQVPAGVYEARGVLVYEGFDANPLGEHQMASTLRRFTIR